MRYLAIVMLLVILNSSALAQLNSNLKEEFQSDDAHGIVIVSRINEISAAITSPSTKILCLQTWDQALPAETQQEIIQWVRAGKTLWFYDTRLAPQFGMKSFFLDKEQFKSKPEKGVLGSSKHPGAATVGISFGNHAVQTAVGQVTVFLPEIVAKEPKAPSYGAIEVAGDTIPLLQFTLDSPALMALRREGKGLIVFKTLLWTEPLSGERFQRNLLDYSAGYQVPGEAGEGRVGSPPGPQAEYVVGNPAVPLQSDNQSLPLLPAESAQPDPTLKSADVKEPISTAPSAPWRIVLKDGTSITGEIENPLLVFETSSASIKLKPEEVQSVQFGNNRTVDKLTTRKGRSMSGLFTSTPIKLHTASGESKIEKEDIQMLIYEPSSTNVKEK